MRPPSAIPRRVTYREIGGHVEGYALHNLGLVYRGSTGLTRPMASFKEALVKHRAAGQLAGEATTLKDLGEVERRSATGRSACVAGGAAKIFEQIADQDQAAETASLLASLPRSPRGRPRGRQRLRIISQITLLNGVRIASPWQYPI